MVKLSRQLICDFAETQRLAMALAQKILKSKPKKAGFVLALEGELGAGKTTFLQGFAKGLGIKEKILSPTFVIMRRYGIRNTKYGILNFYHIDCYRIQKPKEILDLGVKEIISNFEFVDELKRKIVIEYING
jgi:tRNA threonylcarbamoyladenosine biosynthesis protein TsaE